MNPLETYMRAMRPFMLPGLLIIESYSAFLKKVGQGRYSQQSSPQPNSRAPFPEVKLDSAALLPAPAAFDPFATWRNLSAFIPAVNGARAPEQQSQHESGHSDVASENDAITPAKALLDELAAEAEHIRLELAEIDAKDQARAERQSLGDPEPKRESGGITHAAAQKRAKKACGRAAPTPLVKRKGRRRGGKPRPERGRGLPDGAPPGPSEGLGLPKAAGARARSIDWTFGQ